MKHKNIYHKLKEEYKGKNNIVLSSKSQMIDFFILDIKKDITYIKVIPPSMQKAAPIWAEKMKFRHSFSWWKSEYVQIFIDERENIINTQVFQI